MKTKLNQSALKGAIVSAMLLGTATLIAPAYATEQTANLNVSANINMSCTITTTNLAFGNYDPIVTNLSDPLNKMASVTSTCTVGSAGVITLDNGDHYDEGLGRRMAHATEAGNYLTYSVSNASYGGANWGIGAEAVAYTGTGSAVEEDVYGSVAANQFTAEDGSYTDTIIASINY
jgi:spore coat protein U-like protein